MIDLPHPKLKSKLGKLLRPLPVILLLLGLAGIFPDATARAAQTQIPTIDSYELYVPGLDLVTICVGGDQSIPAEVRMKTRALGEDGNPIGELDHHALAAVITGEVQPSDLGTLEPGSASTSTDADYGGSGMAHFTFHGDKAGSGVLVFKATSGGVQTSAAEPMTVENCKYQVTISAVSVYLGGDVNVWTGGLMQTEIALEDGQYKGSGSMKFKSGFSGPECTINYSTFQVPTTITGPEIQNDELTLSFKFDPASLTNTVKCPEGGGSATHTIDLTNLGLPPAKFPAAGGVDTFNVNYAGSDAGDSTVIITVVPIK